MSAYNFIDMAGMQFPHLTVIRRAVGDEVPRSYGRQAFWVCRCECGTVFIAAGQNIRQGNTQSCGCYRARKARERMTKGWAAVKEADV